MSKISHNMASVVEEHNKHLRECHVKYNEYLDNLNDEIGTFPKLFGQSLLSLCKESGVFEEFDKLELLNKELIAKYIKQEKQCLEIIGIDYFYARLHKEFPQLHITLDDFLMLCFAINQMEVIKDIFNGLRRSLNKQLEEKRKEYE